MMKDSEGDGMGDPTKALTRQLLEWIDERPHTYAEVVEVWRTSCPRLSIWEDALGDGLIEAVADSREVRVSAKGRALLGQDVRIQSA